MFKEQSLFKEDTLRGVSGAIQVAKGDASITDLQEGVATLRFRTQKMKVHVLNLSALFTEQLRKNLLAVSTLTERGYETVFKHMGAYLLCPNRYRIPQRRAKGLWYVDLLTEPDPVMSAWLAWQDTNHNLRKPKTGQNNPFKGCMDFAGISRTLSLGEHTTYLQ